MNDKCKTALLKKVIIGIFIVIVSIVFFVIYRKNSIINTYNINLYGQSVVTIYEGDIYYEQGYFAKDINNNDATNLVKISGNVDVTKPGSYVITYSINSFFKKNEITRRVNVLSNPLKDVTFALNGSSIININLGENYQDSGVICTYLNSDCSGYVNIKSNVDITKVGSFDIKYKLLIGGKEKILTRNVNVIGDKYEVKLDHEEIVNHDVVINMKSNLYNFDYMILPNGERSDLSDTKFTVNANGVYNFVIYDSVANYENVSVIINNIDREKPVASCFSIISNDRKSTSFTIEATDNNKIVKYVHEAFPDDIYYENKFLINRMLEKSYILVYDEASNYSRVECSVEYPYIAPTNQQLIYSYSSETLKYWIEKISDYYVSHIWVKDAYNQMKTAIPKFGTLATAFNILTSEINSKGYANKGLIGANGGAFVSSVFDTRLYQAISEWKNTSVTPIVIHNGKVLRNFTNRVFPDIHYSVYGLASDGNLHDYSFPNGSNITKNKSIGDQIISDGIRYTFGFAPVLVKNGKIHSTGSEAKARNALGQIDKNNFVIINGLSLGIGDLSSKMKELGCHTAYNLDGGGSASLHYKGRNNSLVTIRTRDREIADTLYFVEK